MDIKPKNHQKLWVIASWFLANLVPKSEKLILIIQKASISNYKYHAIKCSCPKKLAWKSFLDTILQSRSLCYGPFGQSKMHIKLDYCPDRPGIKQIKQS